LSNWQPLDVADDDLEELRIRLRVTRWPQPWPVPAWDAGTDLVELQELCAYWADEFDWRTAEAEINALPHHLADMADRVLHYLKFDSETDSGPAIVLTNGWPSSFFELVGLAQRLSAPSRFGLHGQTAFTVVVPSIPGFGFSPQRPTLPSDRLTHELWHDLMLSLGFSTYLAHGGDLGAGTTSRLAAAHPEAVRGVHLMAVGAPVDLDERTLSEEERDFLARSADWNRVEGAYMHQHQTRPMTLSVGLSDSPAGMLSWILEKYRAWADLNGDLLTTFSREFLLTQASLYWFTNTIGTSLRPYYEYGRGVARGLTYVQTPTAVALFPADLARPPLSWAQRTHNVVQYSLMPRGGHFAPIEAPDELAADIRRFERQLSRHS